MFLKCLMGGKLLHFWQISARYDTCDSVEFSIYLSMQVLMVSLHLGQPEAKFAINVGPVLRALCYYYLK